MTDDSLLISVTDHGKKADLVLPMRKGEGLVPDESVEGGRGLFLIRELMDHVEHRSHANGNTLLMTKVLR